MDAAAWKEYLKLLNSLSGTLEKLTELERSKTAAVSRGDLGGVEECMKQEQVHSMTLRGLYQKRDKLLARLDLTGEPLRRLAEHAPEGMEEETRRAADLLRRRYDVFQSASEVARNTLECNLHAIEMVQKAKDAPPPEDQPLQADFRA